MVRVPQRTEATTRRVTFASFRWGNGCQGTGTSRNAHSGCQPSATSNTDEVLAAIDAKAKRVGLSRSAYLRRALERERVPDAGPVSVEQLQRVAQLAADLDDPDGADLEAAQIVSTHSTELRA